MRGSCNIFQLEVTHGRRNRWACKGSTHVWGEADSFVREFIIVMATGPWGSVVTLVLCNTRLSTTRRHGPFICLDWVTHVGKAHMVMTIPVRHSGDRLDQGIRLWLEWDDFVVSDWHVCDV